MRLILDNVSKRDYEWLLSMAKALNLTVTTDMLSEDITLDDVDILLDENPSDTTVTDFKDSYGVTDADIATFRQRVSDYQSGKDTPIAWKAIKKRYGLV